MIHGYLADGAMNGALLFAQGMEGFDVKKCAVEYCINEADTAEFVLPLNNPRGAALQQQNAPIVLMEDQRVIFRGDVAEATPTLEGWKISADGALTWLRRVAKAPHRIDENSANRTAEAYLRAIVLQYNNAMADFAHRLDVGTVTVSGYVEMEHSEEYVRTLKLVNEVVDQLGGYLYTAYGDGVPLIHYVSAPSTKAGQTLELGRNVKAVERQLDFTDYASRIYATGKYYVTETDEDGNEKREQRVVNAGYVMDSEAESAWGRVDDVYKSTTDMGGDEEQEIPDKTYEEAAAIILDEAREILQERKTPLQSLTLTALDLAGIGSEFRLFSLGTVARAVCQPLRIDQQMMVQSIKRDYLTPGGSAVTFGKAPRTLTGML